VSRVVSDVAPHLAPIERAIRNEFLPALFDIGSEDIDAQLREVLSHSVKKGGLGVRNPVDLAPYSFDTSKKATIELLKSMLDDTRFDLVAHRAQVSSIAQKHRAQRMEREQDYLDEIGQGKPALARRMLRACLSGIWLSSVPDCLNGNILSMEEFRDNIRLRYNLAPLDMPRHCDGCGERMTVEHALSCKKGGLVHIRHDDVASEFANLCRHATSSSRVQREPCIHSSAGRSNREAAAAEQQQNSTPSNSQSQQQPSRRNGTQQRQQQQNNTSTQTQQSTSSADVDGTRGDVSVHGFWRFQRLAVFDARITDTDARSYRNKDPLKVLEAQEKEKKDKYLRPCHERRKDFTPLVYSVDGMAGREAKGAEKRLASILANKWNKSYSQLVQYVRVRMAISVVRANSLLIRGSRNREPIRPLINSGSAMHGLQTWRDW